MAALAAGRLGARCARSGTSLCSPYRSQLTLDDHFLKGAKGCWKVRIEKYKKQKNSLKKKRSERYPTRLESGLEVEVPSRSMLLEERSRRGRDGWKRFRRNIKLRRTCFQDFGRSGNTLMMVRFEQMQDRSTDRGKREGAERIG